MTTPFRPAALTLALLLLTSCDAREPASEYRTWLADITASADHGDGSYDAVLAGDLAALPITRITLRRSQAYDFTDMKIEFASDHATLRGGMADWPNAEGKTFQAEVPFHELAHLCWLIESLPLPTSSREWTTRVSHGEQRDISWTDRHGRTVELEDYGRSAPPVVAALAAAIETTARRLEWSPPIPAGR